MTQRTVAATLQRHAVEREEKTTAVIKDIAAKTGGEPANLQFAIKSVDSTARKIAEYQEETPTLTVWQAAAKVADSLRYTIVYDSKNFVDKAIQSQAMLKAGGYEPVKMTNYFGSNMKGWYQGYNTVWKDTQGNTFELQYHTRDSLRIKEIVHKLYEKYRVL